MATTQEYLSQLQIDKENLVNNLISKGVEASNEETFTTLVPKVNDIEAGGGSGDTDWAAIGYDETPDFVKKGYDYAVEIKENWTPSTKYSSKFNNDKLLVFMPFVDTSTGTLFDSMFKGCSSLVNVPDLDTSEGTSFNSMFSNCSVLKKAPKIDTSKGTSFSSMFMYCSNLETVPEMDTSNGMYFGDMFFNCPNITMLAELDGSNAISIMSCFGVLSELESFGGFKNIGKAYTVKTTNNSAYSLSFQNSTLLTHDSLMNIINKVYDLNLTYDVTNGGTLYTQKLTIGSTNLAKLTAEEIAIATNKGWTVS